MAALFNCCMVVAGLCVVPAYEGEPLNEALFRVQKLFDTCELLLDQNLRITIDTLNADISLVNKKPFLVAEVFCEFTDTISSEVTSRRDYLISTIENILNDTNISLMGLVLKPKKNTFSESKV